MGKGRVWYKGPEIEAELSYSWAAKHLGDEWLLLKLAFAGTSDTVEVRRGGVQIRTPDGYSVPLLAQSEFDQNFGAIRMAIQRTDAWAGPSVRFLADRGSCGGWYLGAPGTLEVAYEILYPSPFGVCAGPLVFHIPPGVQPGRWMLIIHIEETEARIPFLLELPT